MRVHSAFWFFVKSECGEHSKKQVKKRENAGPSDDTRWLLSRAGVSARKKWLALTPAIRQQYMNENVDPTFPAKNTLGIQDDRTVKGKREKLHGRFREGEDDADAEVAKHEAFVSSLVSSAADVSTRERLQWLEAKQYLVLATIERQFFDANQPQHLLHSLGEFLRVSSAIVAMSLPVQLRDRIERDLNKSTQLLMGVQSCRAAESREELIDREEVLERPVKLHAARYSLAAKNAMKLCAKFGGLGDPDPFLTFVTKPKGHPDFLDYLDNCSAGDDGNVDEVAVTRDAEAITREESDKEKPQASPTVVEMETKKPTQLTIVKQGNVNDTKTKANVNGRQEPWSATVIPAEHIDPLLRAYAISSRNPRGSKIAAITAMAGSDTYMKRKDKDQAKNPSRLKKVKK